MAAAIVELDALADPVGTAAQDDDLAAGRRIRFTRLLVGPVHVRREGLELGGAGIDALIGRYQAFIDRAAVSPTPR